MENDPSAMQTQAYLKVERIIDGYNALVEHAEFILKGRISTIYEHFTELKIMETGHIQVSWPDVYDSYGDCSLRTETTTIEPTLFLKTREEIEAMRAEEEAKQQEHEQERRKQHFKKQALMDEQRDRAEWERLKKKYGEQK